mmetsp:Transcript_33497/g.39363  ORF Transcript_33497/g.39363 Transcript_33497/m.39363 type:complete len:101 (-) Transcript_33497:197-499(-)|eukprot:CAMPEP_0114398884 /NCGR_PEP_ID=MMETSP0102-20121206/15207_1 /TAXON_ID=38822 ORGANISM="Pteridomonas danica, Strain PT" /NCGR_SAMPLE_ID=MMETSP0102 /ASSEMBLY_ACC=CAM_ASM_000212 /LENGTH=100 /DNA_ID=CAMNT_0001560435 /DNA_START=21 /DNA_END=323 /DNA_ORIENTATION=-
MSNHLSHSVDRLLDAHLQVLEGDIETIDEINKETKNAYKDMGQNIENINSFLSDISTQDKSLVQVCQEIQEMEVTTLRLEEAVSFLVNRVDELEKKANEG